MGSGSGALVVEICLLGPGVSRTGLGQLPPGRPLNGRIAQWPEQSFIFNRYGVWAVCRGFESRSCRRLKKCYCTMYMKFIHSLLIAGAALASAAALSSCSVKEDRVPCPCYLNVSFTDREAIGQTPVGLTGWRDAELFRTSIDITEYDPYWVKAVEKGFVDFSAWRGSDKMSLNGHAFTITEGNQCDSLYAFYDHVDCTGEMAYSEVTFHKQFCTVFLDIRKSASALANYYFLVEGNSRGFDLFGYDAVEGAFSYLALPVAGENVVSFRIPRQIDNSLMVTIYLDGAKIGKFPLGEFIARLGYNWNAEDLQDVYVAIDLVAGLITINVEGWEQGMDFDIREIVY